MVYARAIGTRVLLRDETMAFGRERSFLHRQAKRFAFTGLRAAVDAWLTIGTRSEEHLGDLGVSRERMVRFAYAVDNDWFQARIAEAAPRREALRAELGLAPGRPVVLFAAKLIARKAPLEFIEAVARLPRTETPPYILMAGDGDLRGAVEARVAALGLDSVKLLGFRSQRELAALYDLCDLFALPSERETWGLVVNEAMNAGRAVLASDRVGAARDLVREGENGATFAYGDVPALAERMAFCLADRDRLAAMGRESRRLIDTWDFRQNLAGLKTALAAFVPRGAGP